MSDRELLLDLFDQALAAVEAGAAVQRSLARADPGEGPFLLLGAGKAACPMARGARAALGERILAGRVVTKEGHALSLEGLEVREAAHPLPDERSVAAAEEALHLARTCPGSHGLLVLLSGGASALWSAPAESLTLREKRAATECLLRAGADIRALNTVRKHLSRIKGGGLLRAAAPSPCLTLAVSDVAGDVPEWIGSGPTCADSSRHADALGVLEQAGVRDQVPHAVVRYLEEGARGAHPETPAPGEPTFERAEYRVVARLSDALRAAEQAAAQRGLRVRLLGPTLYGEARELARVLAGEARCAGEQGIELLIAGGEPTVRVRGGGKGGRAQELALALALELDGETGITALLAGTDGTDGPTDAAGAVVDGKSPARARCLGLDPRAHLERNDAYPLLHATGDLLVTGPTRTNVGDLGLIRVHPSVRDRVRGRPGGRWFASGSAG